MLIAFIICFRIGYKGVQAAKTYENGYGALMFISAIFAFVTALILVVRISPWLLLILIGYGCYRYVTRGQLL
jgi:hypothetical protein